MKNKTILCLGATFWTDNMGVSALTAGTIEACLHVWPNAKIILLDYGKSPITFRYSSNKRRITVELLNIRFSKHLFLKNNIAILITLAIVLKICPFRLKRIILSRNKYLDDINNADFAVAISGGDSFSDIYGLERLLYVSLPQVLVEIMGKRMVLLPQTLGPFKGWFARVVARYICRRASLVYSRDFAGMRELEVFLGHKFAKDRLRFCYDVGFAVNPARHVKMDLGGFEEGNRHYPAVGLNVSGLLWMGGYKQNNQFGLKVDYRRLVEKLIDYFIMVKKARVLVIPHVFGIKSNTESDLVTCNKLYEDIKGKYGDMLCFVRGSYDQSEIKYIIGLCDFFVGSRMHACIAALSQCIPTVSVAYSKKFIGVMETIGMDPYVADPRDMDENEILDIVDNTWAERNDIRKRLENKMPEVKARIMNLFNEIYSKI